MKVAFDKVNSNLSNCKSLLQLRVCLALNRLEAELDHRSADDYARSNLINRALLLRCFPSLAPLIGEAWNTSFVEIHHVHNTIDYADHFGMFHIGQ